MPYKDAEKRREYQRDWYRRHREQKIAQVKDYHRRHRGDEEFRKKDNEWKDRGVKRRRELLLSILGDKCVLCDRRPKKIDFHEIHGRNHPRRRNTYQLKHKEDFAPLCSSCHLMVHRMMKVFKLTWKQILALKRQSG